MFCSKTSPHTLINVSILLEEERYTHPLHLLLQNLPFLDQFSPLSIHTLYTHITYIAVGSMGQQPSKDELLYQQVNNGNIEGIKALHNDGAGLEVMILQFFSFVFVLLCVNCEILIFLACF